MDTQKQDGVEPVRQKLRQKCERKNLRLILIIDVPRMTGVGFQIGSFGRSPWSKRMRCDLEHESQFDPC
jgi:hypothetical protein